VPIDLGIIPYLPVIILGTVASCFWLVALILFIRAIVIGSRGVRVPGRVTGHSDYMSRGTRMYSAIYEATVDGRPLQCTSGVATSWQTPAVGSVVTLLYRPGNREKPLIALGFSRFLLCIIFAGVAAILTASALPWLVPLLG
jgi:hypothetical protein